MIEYIYGEITEKIPSYAVLDCGGIRVYVSITLSTYDALPVIGEKIKLHIHFVHKEDGMELYGFASKEERELFRKLISVTRIGPKLALAMLAGSSYEKISHAISKGDVNAISKLPRVGKKTAERILLELKGKLILDNRLPVDDISQSAIDALVGLGFTQNQAYLAVNKAKSGDKEMTLDELIKKVLSNSE